MRATKLEPKTGPYAGMVNAVLRNLLRRRDEFLELAAAGDYDLPPWLAQRWRKHYGEETARAIAAIYMKEPPLDVSVKSDVEDWAERLDGIVLPTGSIRLRTRAPVPELPGYNEGEWWVQDAAAALPARLLGAKPDERILDMCAAPGGKTTYIAQKMQNRGKIIAADSANDRLGLVGENCRRLGVTNVATLVCAGTQLGGCLRSERFDRVLVDAPCSGLGVIRRNPEGKWWKEPTDPARLAVTQRAILENAALRLKPGGIMVYSTCSTSLEENERVVDNFIKQHPEFVVEPISGVLPQAHGMQTGQGFFRSWLYRDGMDGFFAARLKKITKE